MIEDKMLKQSVEVVEGEVDESHRFRILPKNLHRLLFALMLIYVLYFLYAAGYEPLPGIEHRSIHIAGGLVFALLLIPMSKGLQNSRYALIFDALLAIMAVMAGAYVFASFQTYSQRVGLPPSTDDIVFGIISFIILFEVARRVVGWAFVFTAAVFVFYALFGPWLPEPFTHSGFDLPRFIATFFLTLNGPYGEITGVSADYILIFIIFAAFVRFSGTAEFFRDLALIALGKFRGGPGKIAVVASSLMGMLTGSSLANVASVGSITIPTMKRTGFRADFAGGVEACSSLGAQIMPPIMGSTVFIMMELLGISYWDIASKCFLIGFLFYISLFFMVDLEAAKKNLKGLKEEDIPKFSTTVKNGWYHIIPIAVLVGMISIAGVSPARGGFWGVVSSIIVMGIFQRPSNSLTKFIAHVGQILIHGARDSLVVISLVGLASLIGGIISVTGLGLHLSTILLDISGGNLLALLLITAIVSIILGTGVPVLVAYSLLAVIVAPALVKMGVNPLAAHLFIFYFGVMSGITPPVAPDAFVAAGIAKASPFRVAWVSMRIANVLYIIPFLFVYNDVLLLNGTFGEIAFAFFTAALGTYCFAAALQGILLHSFFIPWWERLLLGATAFLLVIPNVATSLVGLVVISIIHLIHYSFRKKSIQDNIEHQAL